MTLRFDQGHYDDFAPPLSVPTAMVTIGLQCWQYIMTLLSVYIEGCKNESCRSVAAVLPFAWWLRDVHWLITDGRAR